jgi:hypothetical protein
MGPDGTPEEDPRGAMPGRVFSGPRRYSAQVP